MAQIKNLASGTVITVAQTPALISGVWECGDQRFTDPSGDQYEAIAEGPTYALLTPMQFYLAFATAERMKLKALATTGLPANSAFNTTAAAIPPDPIIEEFWATYQMAVSSSAHIDPNLTSIQEGLEYLASPNTPTPAVIAAARIPQILNGIAQ